MASEFLKKSSKTGIFGILVKKYNNNMDIFKWGIIRTTNGQIFYFPKYIKKDAVKTGKM